MSKITIRDVAKRAEVGIGTVSRVLNNSPHVSNATRHRVLAAIEDLGFKPNAVARQLPRKTHFQNIGVITRPFDNYYSFAERLRGVQNALRNYHETYELMLFNTYTTRDYDERLQSIIQTGVIDGLLIIDLNLTEEQLQALNDSGMPFVGLNHLSDANWACISSNNIDGGYAATKHLLEFGHRRIAYIGDELVDKDGFVTSRERFSGYVRALAEHNVEVDEALVLLGRHGYDEAKKLMEHLLQQDPLPSAIFAMSDTQALGCIAAIREAGLRVPQDFSIIGYDDLELSYHTGLTTVRQHLELSGEMGMKFLLHLIRGGKAGPVPRLPPNEIVVRQTTRPHIEE